MTTAAIPPPKPPPQNPASGKAKMQCGHCRSEEKREGVNFFSKALDISGCLCYMCSQFQAIWATRNSPLSHHRVRPRLGVSVSVKQPNEKPHYKNSTCIHWPA